MSWSDDQFHRLAGTEWWDSDASVNFAVAKARAGAGRRRGVRIEALTAAERRARGLPPRKETSDKET